MTKRKKEGWKPKDAKALVSSFQKMPEMEKLCAGAAATYLHNKDALGCFLVEFVQEIQKELLGSFAILKTPAVHLAFAQKPLTETANTLFGEIWEHHPLLAPPLLWHKAFSEPDVTKLMRTLMQGNSAHAQAFKRTFLQAVAHLCGDTTGRFVPAQKERVEVFAEKMAKDEDSMGRIDLLFEWGKNETARAVVIEVKFQAAINNPCEAYEKTVKNALEKKGGDMGNLLPVFLVQKPLAVDEQKHWHCVFWQELLPRWEHYLRGSALVSAFKVSTEHEQEQLRNCSALRRTIINKIYGAHNEYC